MSFVRVERLRAPRAEEGRACGPCTACCTVMAVTELRKPSRRACDHVGYEGCRIHAERPASCRAFDCLWLRGAIADESMRPDLSGVMFDHFVVRGTTDSHTVAFELWSGALDAPEVRALIAALRELHPVASSLRDGTWVVPDQG